MGEILGNPHLVEPWLSDVIAAEMKDMRALAVTTNVKTGIVAEYRGWYDKRFAPRFSRATRENGLTLDGRRKGRIGGHAGIDIFAPMGSVVRTIARGPSWYNYDNESKKGLGNTFITQFLHGGVEYYIAYAHLQAADKKVEAAIAAKKAKKQAYIPEFSTPIGTSGCTGNARTLPNCVVDNQFGRTEQHVHIEVREVPNQKTDWKKLKMADPEVLFEMRLRFSEEDRVFRPNSDGKFTPDSEAQVTSDITPLW